MTKLSTKFWCIAGVLAIGIGTISFYSYRHKKSALQIIYREFRLGRTDLDVTILSTGTVEPQNRLEIKPPVAGRIDQVLITEGQKVKTGEVLAWMSSTERAALLDAARAQGPSMLQRWSRDYRPTPILAPIDGMIISRNVEAGQTFTNVDAVLVMSDRLTVKTQVDETDIADVKVGQAAAVTLDAYPKKNIPARVAQIAYDAKTVNNVTTYIVDVLPDSVPDFMRSGMTANVTFLVSSTKSVLALPNEALHVENGHYSVTVREPGQKSPREKTVEIGITDGKNTEITSGLQEGDVVLSAEIKAQAAPSGSPFSPFGTKRASK